jgi:hypothetical protein
MIAVDASPLMFPDLWAILTLTTSVEAGFQGRSWSSM